MKTQIKFLLAIAAVLCMLTASAQDDREDVVYLKNGSIYRGVLVEQRPGVSYKIETLGGNVMNVLAGDVDKITKEPKVHATGYDSRDEKYERKERARRQPFEYRQRGAFFQGQITSGFFEFGTRVVTGYKVNQYAYLGVGAGIEGVLSDVHFNNNMDYGGPYIPLFFYYGGDILKKKITPFYQVDAGYAFWPNFDGGGYGYNGGSYSQKGGFMAGGGIGCRFYKNKWFNVTLSANVDIKSATIISSSIYTDYYSNSYTITTRTTAWLVIPIFMFGIGF